MTCERCRGRGWIQLVDLELDDTPPPGAPVTATVKRVRDPQFCPDCGGSGIAYCCEGAACN